MCVSGCVRVSVLGQWPMGVSTIVCCERACVCVCVCVCVPVLGQWPMGVSTIVCCERACVCEWVSVLCVCLCVLGQWPMGVSTIVCCERACVCEWVSVLSLASGLWVSVLLILLHIRLFIFPRVLQSNHQKSLTSINHQQIFCEARGFSCYDATYTLYFPLVLYTHTTYKIRSLYHTYVHV